MTWQDKYSEDERVNLAAELYLVRVGIGDFNTCIFRDAAWNHGHPDLPRSWVESWRAGLGWVLSKYEHQPCCDRVQNRYLNSHCYTIKHTANLFRVPRLAVLRTVRVLRVVMALEGL